MPLVVRWLLTLVVGEVRRILLLEERQLMEAEMALKDKRQHQKLALELQILVVAGAVVKGQLLKMVRPAVPAS